MNLHPNPNPHVNSDPPPDAPHLLAAMLDSAGDAVVVFDASGRIEHWNLQAELCFGWQREEAIGRDLAELVVPLKRRVAYRRAITRYQITGKGSFVERRTLIEMVRRSGESFPAEMTLTPYRQRQELHFVAFLQDASRTTPKRKRRKLVELARTDCLTLLPNRRHLEEHLRDAMRRARRHHRLMAVLFVDIDDFSKINEQAGHLAGDEVLSQFADRLRACLREVDFVARYGGDKFVVVLEEVFAFERLTLVVQKIRQAMEEPFIQGSQPICLYTNIGTALFEDGDTAPDALIRRARRTMDESKQIGNATHDVVGGQSMRSGRRATFNQNRDGSEDKSLNDSKAAFLQGGLHLLRCSLSMDVAFIAHFEAGLRVLVQVDAANNDSPFKPGYFGPLEQSLCQRIVDGRLPPLLVDALNHPEAKPLVTRFPAPVRTHLGTPIVLRQDQIYGTICCFSYRPQPGINQHHLTYLQRFAAMAALVLDCEYLCLP